MRGDARSLRLPGRFGTMCRAESGPTMALSRAAERTTIKRYGQTKENMFVYRCWRRRLQRAVGPGHGRRRVFDSPGRRDGRDVRSSGWQRRAVVGMAETCGRWGWQRRDVRAAQRSALAAPPDERR